MPHSLSLTNNSEGPTLFPGCKGCEATKKMLSQIKNNPRAVTLTLRLHKMHLEKVHGIEPTDVESLLCSIPMVSRSRARLLQELGMRSVQDVASADCERLRRNPTLLTSRDTSFPFILPLIKMYAEAIRLRRPLVLGFHPAFREVSKQPYFMDLEYDPQGTSRKGRIGVFLYGILDSNGNVMQRFLDEPERERELVEWFSNWLSSTRPSLITYSSKSADEPHIRNSMQKYALPTRSLSQARFLDLFYDVIFTQSPRTQMIFLPIAGSISSKTIAYHLGFQEPNGIKIHDGLEALGAYKRYLRTGDEDIRNDLLAYNRCDLERTALIYHRLRELFNSNRQGPENPPGRQNDRGTVHR
jgi:predicted RecB family nuclease